MVFLVTQCRLTATNTATYNKSIYCIATLNEYATAMAH